MRKSRTTKSFKPEILSPEDDEDIEFYDASNNLTSFDSTSTALSPSSSLSQSLSQSQYPLQLDEEQDTDREAAIVKAHLENKIPKIVDTIYGIAVGKIVDDNGEVTLTRPSLPACKLLLEQYAGKPKTTASYKGNQSARPAGVHITAIQIKHPSK